MIKHCYRPGIAKTMRRSGLPIDRGAVSAIGAIHFWTRHVAKHFESKKRSLRRKDAPTLGDWIIFDSSHRTQFAIVCERSIKPYQILERNFRATEW